jgi:hypothetical protein
MIQTSCCSASQHLYDEKVTAMDDAINEDAEEVTVHKSPASSPLIEHDRITMILQLHHQTDGDAPTSVRIALEQLTRKDEEPYTKRLKVTPDKPTEIDFGWLENPGVIVLHNITNNVPHKIPTIEEKNAAEASYLVLRMKSDSPGMCEIMGIRIGAFTIFEVPPKVLILPKYDLIAHGTLTQFCRIYAFSR